MEFLKVNGMFKHFEVMLIVRNTHSTINTSHNTRACFCSAFWNVNCVFKCPTEHDLFKVVFSKDVGLLHAKLGFRMHIFEELFSSVYTRIDRHGPKRPHDFLFHTIFFHQKIPWSIEGFRGIIVLIAAKEEGFVLIILGDKDVRTSWP